MNYDVFAQAPLGKDVNELDCSNKIYNSCEFMQMGLRMIRELMKLPF